MQLHQSSALHRLNDMLNVQFLWQQGGRNIVVNGTTGEHWPACMRVSHSLAHLNAAFCQGSLQP